MFQTSDPKIPKTKDDTPSSRPSWPAENCRLPGFGGVQARYRLPRSAYSARGRPSPRPTRGVLGPSAQLEAALDRPPRGARHAAAPRWLLSCGPDRAPSPNIAAGARSKTELRGLGFTRKKLSHGRFESIPYPERRGKLRKPRCDCPNAKFRSRSVRPRSQRLGVRCGAAVR